MLNIMQHKWVAALYHPEIVITGLQGTRDAKRFEIYRASLNASLTNAMADIYPVIKKLVGEKFFQTMTQQYVLHYPSQHGDVHLYGEYFADFVSDFPPAQALVYLPDMARLEWMLHQSFHAADAVVVDITRLAALSAAELALPVFLLHPSLQLLQSEFPVQKIWQLNQQENQDDETINLDSGAVNLLIFRQSLETVLLPVSLTYFHFVQYLLASHNLAATCEYILQVDAEFDVAESLHNLFEHQLVIALPNQD